MNLIIAGLARDTASTLPRLLLHLEDLICSFKRVYVLVFEDGSEDDTRVVLQRWADHANHDGFCVARAGWTPTVTILDNPTKQFVHKLDKITWLRNEQLNISHNLRHESSIRSHDLEDESSIDIEDESSIRSLDLMETRLVVLDFDLHAFDVQVLIDTISSSQRSNGVICANGITSAGLYRDLFATVFEDGGWAIEMQLRRDRREFINQLNHQRLMPVRSCFGGLAIYNLDTLFRHSCHYTTTRDYLESNNRSTFLVYEGSPPDRICEHIGLHRCLWSKQAGIYIRSDLLAFYGCIKSNSRILRRIWPSLIY